MRPSHLWLATDGLTLTTNTFINAHSGKDIIFDSGADASFTATQATTIQSGSGIKLNSTDGPVDIQGDDVSIVGTPAFPPLPSRPPACSPATTPRFLTTLNNVSPRHWPSLLWQHKH